MLAKKLFPIHPGEILMKEFLKPLGITKYRIAKDLHLSQHTINDILDAKKSITIDAALRLARYFDTTEEFWLGLQMQYDLELAEDKQIISRIEKEVQPYKKAA